MYTYSHSEASMSGRRKFIIPSAQSSGTSGTSETTGNSNDELQQYPSPNLLNQIWSMKVHVSTCPECSFILNESGTFDDHIKDDPDDPGLDDSNDPDISEKTRLLHKWVKLGTPAQVRTIYETVSKCHHYHTPVPSIPSAPHAPSVPHAPSAPPTHSGNRKSRKPVLGENIIGPTDSKYKLHLPRAENTPETDWF